MSIKRKQKDVNLVAQRLFKENNSEFSLSVSLLRQDETKQIMEEQSAILTMFSDKKSKPDKKIKKATKFVDMLLEMALDHLLVMSQNVQGVLVKTSEALAKLKDQDDTSPGNWKCFAEICSNLEKDLLPYSPDGLSSSLLWMEDKVPRNLDQAEDLKETTEFFVAADMLHATIAVLKSIECSVRGCFLAIMGIEIEREDCGLKRYGISWSRLNYSIKSAREVLEYQFFAYTWRLDILTKLRKNVPDKIKEQLSEFEKQLSEDRRDVMKKMLKGLCTSSLKDVSIFQKTLELFDKGMDYRAVSDKLDIPLATLHGKIKEISENTGIRITKGSRQKYANERLIENGE